MAAEFNCHPRRNAAICAHFALAWCRLALRLPDRNYTHMRNSWCNATALWVRLRCLFSSAAAAAAAAASSVLQIFVHCRLFLPLQRLSCHARVPAHHGLIRGGRRRDHPFHKLSIGLLVLLVELLLDVLLCVSPSFDIAQEYYLACLNALH